MFSGNTEGIRRFIGSRAQSSVMARRTADWVFAALGRSTRHYWPRRRHLPSSRCNHLTLLPDDKVCSLLNTDGVSWNEGLVRDTFPDHDASTILQVPVRGQRTTDRLVWHYGIHGRFSVRSAYELALRKWGRSGDSTARTKERNDWSFLWSTHIPPKVQLFSSRVCNEAIPGAVNLRKMVDGDVVGMPEVHGGRGGHPPSTVPLHLRETRMGSFPPAMEGPSQPMWLQLNNGYEFSPRTGGSTL
ncbi:hypothetical protein Salat_0841300 [Sesamum alatum]|uniref:Uncharacterized protein n=1 Tax=Sesamum alatum TaxID=300844 RepID=A0AAE1YID5_9LAMI|nr:hypothetical protein Salat_0841300 [Sesamum alatum]